MEFKTVIELAKYVKGEINKYNASEPSCKSDAYKKLKEQIVDILDSPKNRSLIYRGDTLAVVFSKTLGKWRMKIWNEIVDNNI